VPFAAICTWPLGLGSLEVLDARTFAIGIGIAVFGLIIPFGLDLEGLRRIEPRTYGVIACTAPALAAIAGYLMLGQSLSAPQIAGMIAIMAASAGAAISP
jgi:inner membrane transporter RhtA